MKPAVRYLEDQAGHRIAYTVHGDGPNLVLPAWWISHMEKDWSHPPYQVFLDSLGQYFRVVRYDRVGVGLSSRDSSSQTLEDELEVLARVIDKTLDGEAASFFAFSCGSPVALSYAARHADRVDKICIYGGYLNGADISTREVQAAMVALVRAHWGAGSRALADIFLPDESREEIDAASQQQRYSASAETAASLLELTYNLDASDAISSVTNDLLVLHRTGDRAIPCDAGRKLASALPASSFVELDGRAHPPWIGDSDSILRLAIEFLAGHAYEATDCTDVADKSYVDVNTRSLNLPEGRVPLTALEFSAMRYFEENTDRVVTREELLEHVWNTPFSGSNKVDVLIRALRKKMDIHASSLETIPGHGYMLKSLTK